MRNYFTKRNLIIGIIVLIAFLLGGLVGERVTKQQTYKEECDYSDNKQHFNYGSSTFNQYNTDLENKILDEKDKSKSNCKATSLGDEFITSDFSFKVLNVENTKKLDFENDESRTTDANFATIRVQYTNISKNPLDLGDYDFKVTNEKSQKTYQFNYELSSSVNDALKYEKKQTEISTLYYPVNPDMKAETVLVFEMQNEIDSDFVLQIENKMNQNIWGSMDIFKS